MPVLLIVGGLVGYGLYKIDDVGNAALKIGLVGGAAYLAAKQMKVI